MSASRSTYSVWRKSTRSGPNNGNCVEVGFAADGAVIGIRDTKQAGDPGRPVLEVPAGAWRRLLAAVRRGELSG